MTRGLATGLRIAVVDDHPAIRTLMRMVLCAEGAEIVSDCGEALQALEEIRETLPDVAIIDIRMPGMNGIELIQEIKKDTTLDGVRILVISGESRIEVISDIMDLGVDGFLHKQSDNESWLGAVIAVGVGSKYIDPAITHNLQEQIVGRAKLTERECEILTLVSRGMVAGDIADALCVSEPTIRKLLRSIYSKLGVQNAPEAVSVALHQGILRNIDPAMNPAAIQA